MADFRLLLCLCMGATALATTTLAQELEKPAMEAMPGMAGMPGMDMPGMDMSGTKDDMAMPMTGVFGPYAMSREASGTSWQPESTPDGGLHFMAGQWMLMAHGYVDAIYDDQGRAARQ